MAFKLGKLGARSSKKERARRTSEPEEGKFTRFQEDFRSQFQEANWNDPATLPPLPKMLLFIMIAAAIVVATWFLVVRGQLEELEVSRSKEQTLKAEFTDKTTKVANLEPLREQRRQAEEYVLQLEKQLPSKSEMDSLLSDINQAGVGRNLQFELFKPGAETIKAHYAELPVAIRVSGKFPEIAAFAADIAHLSRIVILADVGIAAPKGEKDTSNLVLEASANTYRYLDADEKQAYNNAQKNAKKQGGK